jgi:cation diffusion facilitator CzcD-associated flavoprotein CzcO
MVAARLKALGVDSITIDKNAEVGQNWSRRFDCLTLHVPTSSVEMPFASKSISAQSQICQAFCVVLIGSSVTSAEYKKELHSPHLLTKDEVAEHLHQYARQFSLQIMHLTTIRSTSYDPGSKTWKFVVDTAGRKMPRTIIGKHLVQATGIGSSRPYVPQIENNGIYSGISLHSTEFRNAKVLAGRGVKVKYLNTPLWPALRKLLHLTPNSGQSVAIIGSANTAFDVAQDCYEAGLEATMVARSPTYIFPLEYIMDPRAIGAFDRLPLEAADRMVNTFPIAIDGQFSHGLMARLASSEP